MTIIYTLAWVLSLLLSIGAFKAGYSLGASITVEVWKKLYKELNSKYCKLLIDWNSVVDKINALGGMKALKAPPSSQLTDKDIKQMIALCHPDKHNGNEAAKEITIKLLGMRKPNNP